MGASIRAGWLQGSSSTGSLLELNARQKWGESHGCVFPTFVKDERLVLYEVNAVMMPSKETLGF